MRSAGEITVLVQRSFSDPSWFYSSLVIRLKRRLFGRDRYPAIGISVRHRGLRVLLSNASFRFWNAAARRNPAFDPIYQPLKLVAAPHSQLDAGATRGAATSPLELTGPLVPVTTIRQLVENAQRYGIAVMDDFLNESDYRIARDEFDGMPEAPSGFLGRGVEYYTHTPSPAFMTLFDDAMAEIAQRIFGRSQWGRQPMCYLERDVFVGPDADDPNALLHIDRFVPCVKAFYYPRPIPDADQSPLGYVPESHRVSEQYRASVREAFDQRNFGDRPFMMPNPTVNSERPVLANGNTLVLAFTNGLHRRTPFGPTALPGDSREVAFFMFYNDYTRISLLTDLVLG